MTLKEYKSELIAALTFVVGGILAAGEMLLSYQFFNDSGLVGFVVVVLGQIPLSIKISKQKIKIKRKHLGEMPSSGSGMGPGDGG